jgi:hypothetical protein
MQLLKCTLSHTIHNYSDECFLKQAYVKHKLLDGLELIHFIIHLCFYIFLFDVSLPEDGSKLQRWMPWQDPLEYQEKIELEM